LEIKEKGQRASESGDSNCRKTRIGPWPQTGGRPRALRPPSIEKQRLCVGGKVGPECDDGGFALLLLQGQELLARAIDPVPVSGEGGGYGMSSAERGRADEERGIRAEGRGDEMVGQDGIVGLFILTDHAASMVVDY
jgi:hypothetical protein